MNKHLYSILLSAFVLLTCSAHAQLPTVDRPTPVDAPPASTPMSEAVNRPGPSGTVSKSTGTDLVGSLASATNFSTLQTALQAAGLVDNAKESGPFTVFAPSNEAFKKLPAGALQGLTQPANKAKLQGILANHVVQGNFLVTDLKEGQKLKTLGGGTLTIRKKSNAVLLVDAQGGSALIITSDIQATNGTVHAIDGVLMAK